jgi:hypothetical protein
MIKYDVSGRTVDPNINSKGITSYADIYGIALSDKTVNANIWYGAGVANCAQLQWSVRCPNNATIAYPLIAPYRGGSLSGLCVVISRTVAGNQGVHIGMYSSSGDAMLYPNELLAYASGSVSSATSGVRKFDFNYNLNPGELYWLTLHIPTATTEQYRGLTVACANNLIGFDSNLNTQPIIGYYESGVSRPGWFPNPFPTGAHFLTAPPMPAVFYSFSR